MERSGEKRKGRLLRVMSRQLPALRGGGGAAAVGPSRARRGARVTWQEQRGERAGHSWRLRFPLSPPPFPEAAPSRCQFRFPARAPPPVRLAGRAVPWPASKVGGGGAVPLATAARRLPLPPPPGLPRWAPPPVRGLYGGRGGAKGGREGGRPRGGPAGRLWWGRDGRGWEWAVHPSVRPSVRPPSRPSSGGGGQQRGGSRPEPREGRWAPRGAARPATPPLPGPPWGALPGGGGGRRRVGGRLEPKGRGGCCGQRVGAAGCLCSPCSLDQPVLRGSGRTDVPDAGMCPSPVQVTSALLFFAACFAPL